MFKIANAINLFFAGQKISNLMGVDSNSMPDVKNRSIFQMLDGSFWMSLLLAIANGLSKLLYVIVRWILNIVDFMQFFVKHLLGVDYWEKGNVKLETLGDSDIIFKFLYNPAVQRVFKYMLGLFVVLLILFAIIAIVKNQYAVASDADKANNDAMTVFKRCMKAIFLVIIVPVMLVMGILASNAVLAGLINTFNVNNRLTLGGQVFSASAYDANRYRKYAENGNRYSVSNKVNVTIGSHTVKIDSLVTPIVPRSYGKDNKFTGFAFYYPKTQKNYLYYVSEADVNEKYETDSNGQDITGYNFYVKYFQEILGATLKRAGSGWGEATGKEYFIKAALNECKQDSEINQAAYNTWYYNSIAFEASARFENTVKSEVVEGGWISDGAIKYSDAKRYVNNEPWGAFHDGGKNGLVALPEEFLVMGDVIDYTINDAAEIAYVNAKSQDIDWSYGLANEGGYLSDKFVRSNRSGGVISELKSFVVNYKDRGYVVYDTPADDDKTAETDGVVYIVAYYSAARKKFIPLVNGKTYVDDYGEKHTFKSDNLDDNYHGLIVARGILESSFRNQYGNPTEINVDWSSSGSDSITTDTPLYYRVTADNVSLSSKITDDRDAVTFNSDNVSIIDGKAYTKLDYAQDINTLNSVLTNKSDISNSLPTQFGYKTTRISATAEDGSPIYGTETLTLSNISWTAMDNLSSININSNSTKVAVFKADKTIKARVPSGALTNVNGTAEVLTAESAEIYELPLYAFIYFNGTGALKVEFVVSYYQNPTNDFFKCDNANTKGCTSALTEDSSGQIKATYNVDNVSSTTQAIVAQHIFFGDLSSTGNKLLIGFDNNSNTNTLVFNDKRTSKDSVEGSIFGDPIVLKTGNIDFLSFKVLQFYRDYPYEGTESVNSKSVIKYNGAVILPTATEVNGSVTSYYYRASITDGYGPIVRVTYNSETHELKLLQYKELNFYLNNVVMKAGTTSDGEEIPYKQTQFDMIYRGSRTVETDNKTETVYTYSYRMKGSDYYFDYTYTCTNGIESLEPRTSSLVKIDITYHNMFAFGIEGSSENKYYQYSPVTNKSNDGLKTLLTNTAYVRPDSIFTKYLSTDDGKYLWQTEVTLNDDENTPFATFYTTTTDNTVSYLNAIKNSNRVISGTEDLRVVPVYENIRDKGVNDIISQHLKATATITFSREYVSANRWYFDFQLFSSWFNDKTWRINLCIGAGFSENQSRTSAFQILGAALRVDYNFASKNAPSLEMQIFYIPMLINFVILIFAACLLLSLLGKAVWGLIQRIFDITLYFIILPGVASLMPFDDGAKFTTWKNGVISKTLSAYGTMLGLNLFFILCPAIKSISHLFTQADLDTLAEGNFLRGVTPGFINNLTELLFMLVALTMIQTTPKLIQSFVDTTGSPSDIISMGEATKSSVKSMVDEVGSTVSGKKLLDTGKNFAGSLKNFVPGSAVYDAIKGKFKKKDEGGGGASDEQKAAEERRRADADASLARSQDLSANADNMTAPQINAGQIVPDELISQVESQEAAANAEAQQNPSATAANVGLTHDAVENIGENVSTHVADAIGDITQSTEANPTAEASRDDATTKPSDGEDAAAPDHVAFADVAGRVEGQDSSNVDVDFEGSEAADETAEAVAEQIGQDQNTEAGTNAERARMYAESAREAADASRGYADIAGGRVDKNYGIQEDNRTKDQKKLDELLAERDQRLKDQAEGKADVGLSPFERGKAYRNYNVDKAAKDSIFDANEEGVREAAIEEWNTKWEKVDQSKMIKFTGDKEKDKEQEKVVKQAVQDWKDEQAFKLYDAKYGTSKHGESELKAARKMLTDDQNVKKAVARSQYGDKVIDDKIAKQQEKIALKEAGLYEAPLKKALLAAPRAIFSHKTSDKEEDKLRAKLDKWEKVGKESSDKLEDMEKTYTTEFEEFKKKNKLVIKDGKIDRKETARNHLVGVDRSDDEALKKEMEFRDKEFDKLQKEYDRFTHKDTYISERRDELQSSLNTARRRFDVYSAQLQNGRSGLVHSFAREARSGARAVKSSWQSGRVEDLANSVKKADEKAKRSTMTIDWSVLKDQGLDVDHKDHEYTVEQQAKLKAKYAKIDKADKTMKAERIALTAKGGVFKAGTDELDRIATAKNLMRSEDPKKYSGYIDEPTAVAYMSKNIDKINKLQTKYLAAKDASKGARDSFASTVHKFDITNHQTFIGKADDKLKKAQLKHAKAEKARLVSELDAATRSGRLEEKQEASYLEKIKGVDKTIADMTKERAVYRAPKKVKAKVIKQFTSMTAVDNDEKQKKVSIKEQARQALSGQISSRKSQISSRDAAAAQKTAEKVSREEVRRTMLDEATQRAYISDIRKALIQGGYAGDVSKIRTTDDAKRVAKEVEKNLMNAAKTNKSRYASRVASGAINASEYAEYKAQEKLLKQRLKKIRSIDTSVAMKNSLNIREDIKAASERAAGTAIRNQYKNEWNKFIKREGMRDIAKSGSSAYEKNAKMQKQLISEKEALEKRVKALEAKNDKDYDKMIQSLKAQMDKQDSLIKELKSMNTSATQQAKKAMKNFTSINKVMQDMRRQSKYKIPGMKNQGSGNDNKD